MSDLILCGPCGNANNNKNAEKWCTVCTEGLCTDCEKVHKSIRTSRNHRLISIEDYRQIKDISSSLTCKDHDKQLELYCNTHDVAVCLCCVSSHHQTCTDIIPLRKAAENTKHSTALADLEDTLSRSLLNIQHIITDRAETLKNMDCQKQTIKATIIDTRARIKKKIDDLEQKLLLELDTKWRNCNSEATKRLNRLKKSERDLNCLKEQTSQLKSLASDIQVFLGTRQINEAVSKEVETAKNEIKSLFNYEIHLELQPSIMSFMHEMDQIGKIYDEKISISLPFNEGNVDQDIQLPVPEMKSIDSIHVKLKKRFNVKQKEDEEIWLSGCTMLQNGNLMIADYKGEGVLMEYSEDGQHLRNIPCSEPPFDLTVIDNDRIAVTYGHRKYIQILNTKNHIVERKVKFDKDCYGISYQANKLFIIIDDEIVILDIAGNVLITLTMDCRFYLETTVDRIYYNRDHTVHCISMTGEEIWVHKEKFLVSLGGITVDDHQNVLVADGESNSLIVIQHDGKTSKTLLSETDGLNRPTFLHYNKDNKTLLLCNEDGSVALFNVE
ncbi:unnamed protein product [Mytilus edulis]|uniref:B box-type domain-containing protein n=1 Tax=Mytilus edulis TaxID=6550 RepID=A0A8S3PRZ9_MYTED|nr:unnamed protein product [Mytilus edulis]